MEGYPITELADFLGVNRITVSRRFNQYGWRAMARDELPPLAYYEDDFNARGDDTHV